MGTTVKDNPAGTPVRAQINEAIQSGTLSVDRAGEIIAAAKRSGGGVSPTEHREAREALAGLRAALGDENLFKNLTIDTRKASLDKLEQVVTRNAQDMIPGEGQRLLALVHSAKQVARIADELEKDRASSPGWINSIRDLLNP